MDRLEEVKKANKNIADFIVNVDGGGKICLLPYNEFLKKYFGFKEEEKTRLLVEFEELLETGKVSPDYLLKEWKKIDFGRFIGSMIKTIENTFILEGRMKFTIEIRNKYQTTINSNISLNEKIISLSNLVKNYIQFYGTKQFDDDVLFNDIESELNHLKEVQTQKMLTKDVQVAHVTKKELSEFEPKNPYPEMFQKIESWELFKHYISEANQSEIIREAGFIYRMMREQEKPPLIHNHIKPGMFRNWFNSHLEELNAEYLSETKTWDYCIANHREKRYNRLKNRFFKSNSTK
jgi:hypothetical protein